MGKQAEMRYTERILRSMPTNTPPPPGNILAMWEAPSQPHYEHSVRWYIGAAATALVLLGYSVWTKAWTFTGLLVLIAGVYSWHMRRTPPVRRMTITDRGFQLDRVFTPWERCKGFWMLQGEHYIELHFERADGPLRHCKIQTGDVDAQALRNVLHSFTEERTDRTEDTLDMISRLLKI